MRHSPGGDEARGELLGYGYWQLVGLSEHEGILVSPSGFEPETY